MSEESIHLEKVLAKNVLGIGNDRSPAGGSISRLNIIPIPPVCEHFRANLRTRPNDPLWATPFADQIVMIALSVVYEALVRHRLLFFEPEVRSMVQSVPPSWLVKDSSILEEDIQILWNILNSDA